MLRRWITQYLARFLTQPLAHYERRGWNDLAALKLHIRKGDVLLVEGDQRISAIIKYLTQSSWSHAALYVGDELVRRDAALRESFGDDSEHMLVEALPEGVAAAPLSKYVDFNVRLCRPHRLRAEHLRLVLDEALNAIGWRYDLRNLVDLARHLLPMAVLPRRLRRRSGQLGSGADTQVICTSLLGHIFQKVSFPVLPSVTFPEGMKPGLPERAGVIDRLLRRRRPLYAGRFRKRHPTLLTPRDFDLSPYFEIVKFNVIREKDFDYLRMQWIDDEERNADQEAAPGPVAAREASAGAGSEDANGEAALPDPPNEGDEEPEPPS